MNPESCRPPRPLPHHYGAKPHVASRYLQEIAAGMLLLTRKVVREVS
jgi:hypothetical protein